MNLSSDFISYIKNITKRIFFRLMYLVRPIFFSGQHGGADAGFYLQSFRFLLSHALWPSKKSISNLELLRNSGGNKYQIAAFVPCEFYNGIQVVLLVFKDFNGLGPSYLSDLLLYYQPSQILRSCNAGLLTLPEVNCKTHGQAFSYYSPVIEEHSAREPQDRTEC